MIFSSFQKLVFRTLQALQKAIGYSQILAKVLPILSLNLCRVDLTLSIL